MFLQVRSAPEGQFGRPSGAQVALGGKFGGPSGAPVALGGQFGGPSGVQDALWKPKLRLDVTDKGTFVRPRAVQEGQTDVLRGSNGRFLGPTAVLTYWSR